MELPSASFRLSRLKGEERRRLGLVGGRVLLAIGVSATFWPSCFEVEKRRGLGLVDGRSR